jgi:exoribonuclease II
VPRVGQTFDALVTGASDKGTWVRTFVPPVEGKLMSGTRGLDVGDTLRVRLTGIDVEKGFIDFVRAG